MFPGVTRPFGMVKLGKHSRKCFPRSLEAELTMIKALICTLAPMRILAIFRMAT